MKSNNYIKLTKDLKCKDSEDFALCLDARINEMIITSTNPIALLKEMICYLESYNYMTETYTFIAIAYAVLVGLIPYISKCFDDNFLIVMIPFGVIAIIIAILALVSANINKKRGFVLNALKFKYEELRQNALTSVENNEKEVDKSICSEDENTYIVKVIKK